MTFDHLSTAEQPLAAAAERAEGIDVLVNLAGIWLEGPSADVTESQWDRVLNVNLKGGLLHYRGSDPASCTLARRNRNPASDAGLVGNSGAAVYCASKGGLVLLTKTLALGLAPQGIRVNAVCPQMASHVSIGSGQLVAIEHARRQVDRPFQPKGDNNRLALTLLVYHATYQPYSLSVFHKQE